MASPLRLAHPLKRKDNTECLAINSELPTASRLYSFISKDNLPIRNISPPSEQVQPSAGGTADASKQNSIFDRDGRAAKRKADKAGIEGGRSRMGPPAPPPVHEKMKGAGLERLPPLKADPRNLTQQAGRSGGPVTAAVKEAQPAEARAAVAEKAAALSVNGASAEQQALPAPSIAAAQTANGAAAYSGYESSSTMTTGGGRKKATARKSSCPPRKVELLKPRPKKSRFAHKKPGHACEGTSTQTAPEGAQPAEEGSGPAREAGPSQAGPSQPGPPRWKKGLKRARKSIPKPKSAEGSAEAAAGSVAGGSDAAAEAGHSEPGAPAEELVGATPEKIAAMDIKYGLTTPHEVSPEDFARGQEILQKYRERCAKLKAEGQRKEDMVAFRTMKEELKTPLEKIGHIRGFKAGDKFRNKGELAISGIHCNIAAGIYAKEPDPAYAIVLSGGYKDDADGQEEVLYTGMGGQRGGVHVEDQEWTKGNLALKLAFEQGTPVRICRGSSLEKTYDGLYRITRAWKEKGKDGFLICRFRMVPIPGHSHVSQLVHAKVVNTRRAFRVVRDVEEDEARQNMRLNQLAKANTRPGFICADISNGVERVQIPAFNETAEEVSLDPLEYIRNSTIGSEAAREIAELARAFYEHKVCGRKKMENSVYVGTTGMLKARYINCTCIFECVSSCTERQCSQNKVVTTGIQAPLEVFYTGKERGWGLRCSRDLRVGEFVCEYAGEVITTEEAEAVDPELDHDKYLYDMRNFSGAATSSQDPEMQIMDKPPVPPDPDNPEAPTKRFLTINARIRGNVGRFMNHNCAGGNVLGRTVLAEGDSGLMYRVGMFTHSFVAAGTELTYDYQWDMKALKLKCLCGAKSCKGWQKVEPAAEDDKLAYAKNPGAAGTGDKKKFAQDLLGDEDDDMEE